MLISWLLPQPFILCPSFFIGVLWDEIMDWAKDVLNRLSSVVRKAGVYIKRIPNAIKVIVKHILGKVETTKSELTTEDIEQMLKGGVITEQHANDLLVGREVHLANIVRD